MIHHGDCLEVMAGMEAETFDAIVTDPPYGIAFMGKAWDHSVPGIDYWRAALRVIRPGGYLLAFGGARTHHRMACAIEDSGWEIRDCIMWLYGTGFPKGKAQLKPAHEPIVVARKSGPIQALQVDDCRVGKSKTIPASPAKDRINQVAKGDEKGRRSDTSGFDPKIGRWPANIVHDGSDEVMEAFAAFGERSGRPAKTLRRMASIGYGGTHTTQVVPGYPADTGTAARFYFCAKASPSERDGARHPTIKPLALMKWLVKLVTPPGGLVLDPFAGSGTTGLAARNTGRRAVLIEREAEYVEMIRKRLADESAAA